MTARQHAQATRVGEGPKVVEEDELGGLCGQLAPDWETRAAPHGSSRIMYYALGVKRTLTPPRRAAEGVA